MKKVLIGITLASLTALPLLAAAQAAPPETIPADLDILTILENVVDWLFTILLIVAAIFLVIAAFNFITASGDPEKVASARNFVLYALIGVAVAVAARGLIAFVRMVMGG